MSKSKQVVLAVVILAMGITFVNSYLFALPQNACWCDSRSLAQTLCGAMCILNGGCWLATPVSALCDDSNYCVTGWMFLCFWGNHYFEVLEEWCWDCVNP